MEEAFRAIADDLEIRNLVALLAQYADGSKNIEDYLDLFTEDAIWEYSAPPQADEVPEREAHRLVGRDAIERDRRRLRAVGFQGPGTRTFHLNTTLAVRLTGPDSAEATSYFLYVDGNQSPAVIPIMGTYSDTFVRVGTRWKLKHRVADPSATSAVPTLE
ncbi:nuclear transport factor 2 family protein [Microbacterium sp. Mu-80]|uniref:Nuclear transport factor 2 family protein n=1 Tax=Microbacterium bandirmense TaxID=3122050 RepID=A0ABU8L9Y0_9MICO